MPYFMGRGNHILRKENYQFFLKCPKKEFEYHNSTIFWLKLATMKRRPVTYYIDGILAQNRVVLSQAITLAESKLAADNILAGEVINGIIGSTGNSIRIGVTGVPGVGKSTFIEAFGTYLVKQGKKVAVLAIDPSSKITGGSILGDKTRMEFLSRNPDAFIRPSPTGSTLGGVAERTRECVLLCEAAGFDVIIVETVGVGQSEVVASSMVDFFLLLMLAGAGDELQGIKKGIMEMIDALVINKADGDNVPAATRAKSEYKKALHLFPPKESNWTPQVKTCSSLERQGLEEIWQMMTQFKEELSKSGFFHEHRRNQSVDWFRQRTVSAVLQEVYGREDIKSFKTQLEQEIIQGTRDSNSAVQALVNRIFTKD